MDTTTFYLVLSAVLFSLGTFGVLIRKNAIVVFMCIELMLNAVNISLIALSQHFQTVDGQIYVFFVMAIAAAEAAVGLAIILTAFRNFMTINAGSMYRLHG